MRIAILTSVFVPEYGVARVVASQLPYLVKAGMTVDLYACELNAGMVPEGVKAIRVPTHLKGLRWCLKKARYDVIIAHTDPFYQFLAEDNCGAVTIGYEHGYPPVELCLPEERNARVKEIGNRLGSVYPALSQIVTISHYGVEYLKWPKACVIYNGADHYELMCKSANSEKSSVVHILAVTRYRKGEWKYKGIDQIVQLKKDMGESCRITVVGRGDDESVQVLRDSGIEVPGTVSDQDLARYYSCCDALVSFSQWELFNLPLAEAGFAHKPALALDLCAHPEVTPFVFDSYETIRDYLKKSTKESLKADGEKMFQFVDSRFRWKQNGKELVELIRLICPDSHSCRPSIDRALFWLFWSAREFVRQKFYKRWKGPV